MMLAAILATICLGQGAPATSANSEVFRLAKQLIGGHWEGTVGKAVKVGFEFYMEDNGNKLVGIGTVGADTNSPLHMRFSYGWDPDAKEVYYLDQHGYDTVYFGHVKRVGESLVTDFRGLVGDKGHYISSEEFGPDKYSASMKAEENGKWTDMGLHIEMHRKS